MASMRDIKRRKGSIQSTQQITKAMKLVSTVKLQRAKTNAEKSKTYFHGMYDTVQSILKRTKNLEHRFLKEGTGDKKAVVVITSNRGLAGGYNSNIVKLITQGVLKDDKLAIYAVGKKGRDALGRSYEIAGDYSDFIDEPVYAEAMKITNQLLEDYDGGKISEIYLAYTGFKNTVSHIPTLLRLLPVVETKNTGKDTEEVPAKAEKQGIQPGYEDSESLKEALETEAEDNTLMNFEPAPEDALDMLIPKYITSIIYGAMIEAVASENGARMQAMDSATSNAEEMIDKLTLQYNRARQGSITQELTEIIAGANAIS
ncbi:MAG: ATP synthase F1 subunit gamma [Lachnospiraceae bacterium]|nr:ATP synthase F1 subunit gamma [Lachnospiraceae bacterium]